MTTFTSGREAYLRLFDDAVQKIRAIIADPGWANRMYPPFCKAIEQLNEATKRLESLNGLEQDVISTLGDHGVKE